MDIIVTPHNYYQKISLFFREIGMNDKIEYSQTVVYAGLHDDLRVLKQAFSLPEINYIDISLQTRLTQMMKRWPLLAELQASTGSR